MEEQNDVHRDDGLSPQPVRITCGQRDRKVMPHSEVCLHMQIAGREMAFALLNGGSVQLLDDDGSHFSSPITNGEAGIHDDRDGHYLHSQFKGA